MHQSILSNITPDCIHTDPFFHVIIDNALPKKLLLMVEALYEYYEKNYNRSQCITNNVLIAKRAEEYLPTSPYYSGNGMLLNKAILDFIRYHISQKFLNEVISTFPNQIKGIIDANVLPSPYKHNWKSVPRYLRKHGLETKKNMNHSLFYLDLQFCFNTPVKTPNTTVIKPHIDSRDKLFNALIYLRPDSDKNTGGDLCLHQSSNEWKTKNEDNAIHDIWQSENDNIKKVIKYKRNRMVLFFNSNASVHSVSKRPVTNSWRRYINLTCDHETNFSDLIPLI